MDPTRRLLILAAVPVVVTMLLVQPTALSAQWPPRIKNLQVLPADTDPRELVNLMVGITQGLGVRCTYCHVGEEGQPITTYDFASDEKVTKRKARVMLGMVRDINNVYLAKLPTSEREILKVECRTCHHGQPRPVTLEQQLMTAMDTHGADSAVARYRSLRKQYYGSDTYDFSENRLNNLGYELLGSDRPRDAVAIFELNVEMYPESANPYDSLADGLKAVGDSARALENYKKAFAIDPEMRGLRARIDSLER